jgi:hypothetical protein
VSVLEPDAQVGVVVPHHVLIGAPSPARQAQIDTRQIDSTQDVPSGAADGAAEQSVI